MSKYHWNRKCSIGAVIFLAYGLITLGSWWKQLDDLNSERADHLNAIEAINNDPDCKYEPQRCAEEEAYHQKELVLNAKLLKDHKTLKGFFSAKYKFLKGTKEPVKN